MCFWRCRCDVAKLQRSKCRKWDSTRRPAATPRFFGCWVSWKPSGGAGKFTVAWVASQTVADGGNLAAASSAKTSVSWHACSKLDKWGIGRVFFKLLIKPKTIRMWATVIFFSRCHTDFYLSICWSHKNKSERGRRSVSEAAVQLHPSLPSLRSLPVIYVSTRFNSSSEQNSSNTFTALVEKTFRKTVKAVKGVGALVNLAPSVNNPTFRREHSTLTVGKASYISWYNSLEFYGSLGV